jgi:hypothetical protein
MQFSSSVFVLKPALKFQTMNKTQLLAITLFCLIQFLGISCSDDDSGETLISATNGNKSHNDGKNCMNCHVAGGGGEGTFSIAGTVYNSTAQSVYKNAVITLTTEANGAGIVIATIYGDAKGNFYSTALIDFSGGLYTTVKGTTGTLKNMSSPITQGACNSCHGSATGKITVQ